MLEGGLQSPSPSRSICSPAPQEPSAPRHGVQDLWALTLADPLGRGVPRRVPCAPPSLTQHAVGIQAGQPAATRRNRTLVLGPPGIRLGLAFLVSLYPHKAPGGEGIIVPTTDAGL